MSWMTLTKSLQALLAHSLLLCFTILLVLKLDRSLHRPWWVVFSPLWMFHGLVARGRFSLPAPASPHGRHWAPYHAVMATPLLLSFEMLLCIYLQTSYAVSLKIVFLPLLAFMLAVLVDNIRMCRALMPGDDENMSDEAIWRTLPHFWVAISAVFFIAATVFTLLKLCGDIAALGWWDLFINFGIAEFFAFLTCTKWYNPDIHRNTYTREAGSSSMTIRYLDWNRGLIVSSNEEQRRSRICNLQEIGGHIMKIPLITFQILLFMRLEGTPTSAKSMPARALFIPVFMMQGAAVSYAAYRFVEKIVFRLKKGAPCEKYILISSNIREFFGFFRHGSRLLGWWSIDESSQVERARLFCNGASGYNTFPPERVKKMTKSNLVEQIWKLQAALSEQSEVMTFSQEEYERLQHEKILCRVCFEDEINMVLLPCRHHSFCSSCCEKCKKCPICRVPIEARMPVYDV